MDDMREKIAHAINDWLDGCGSVTQSDYEIADVVMQVLREQVPTYQYYYKQNECPAKTAKDEECVCWHDEGTGPFPGERADDPNTLKTWRCKVNKKQDLVGITSFNPLNAASNLRYPAPMTSAPVVDEHCYVQPVPDHCDRITWRNRYYHLPLKPQSVPEGYSQGIEAVAKMIEKKADDYALEYGYDDMGGLSFGSGIGGEIKLDYYNSLCELADDTRAMLAAAPKPKGT